MRVLVTRAQPGADKTAAALLARGHLAVPAPVLRIEPAAELSIGLKGAQALLFTSPNGVRAFASLRSEREIQVLAVGAATLAAALAAGFSSARSAESDAAGLAELAQASFDPKGGRLVHIRGKHAAGDLAGALREAGFEIEEAIAYEAVAEGELPAAARAALTEATLDAALFHSPRGAEIFMTLARKAGLQERLKPLAAIAISANAAAPLGRGVWKDIRIAARPEEAALFDALASPPGAA